MLPGVSRLGAYAEPEGFYVGSGGYPVRGAYAIPGYPVWGTQAGLQFGRMPARGFAGGLCPPGVSSLGGLSRPGGIQFGGPKPARGVQFRGFRAGSPLHKTPLLKETVKRKGMQWEL